MDDIQQIRLSIPKATLQALDQARQKGGRLQRKLKRPAMIAELLRHWNSADRSSNSSPQSQPVANPNT